MALSPPGDMTATMQTLPFKQFAPEPGQEWPLLCEQEIERRYQVVPSVVCAMCCLFGIIYCFFVIISRQQRRVQLMKIKQREERKEKKKKKKRPHHHHPNPPHKTPHPPEPAFRRKPTPIRRFDGDVISPGGVESFCKMTKVQARVGTIYLQPVCTGHQRSKKNKGQPWSDEDGKGTMGSTDLTLLEEGKLKELHSEFPRPAVRFFSGPDHWGSHGGGPGL